MVRDGLSPFEIYDGEVQTIKTKRSYVVNAMNKSYIEVKFTAAITNGETKGQLEILSTTINVKSQHEKMYKIRVAVPVGVDTVTATFTNQTPDLGDLLVKNLEITCLEQYRAVDQGVSYIAHRGLSKYCPENTMPAFAMANNLGFKYIECDVTTTLEKEWVVIHDPSIDRTSNGSGLVSSKTLEELRQYDFGSYKGEHFVNTPILTFEEFVAFCAQTGIHPYIEIKDESDLNKIHKLVATVKQYNIEVTWISFSWEHLLVVSRLTNQQDRYGYLVDLSKETIEKVTQLGQRVFIDCYYECVSKELVSYAHQLGVTVECWTINNIEELKWMISLGIKGITTDHLNLGGCYF